MTSFQSYIVNIAVTGKTNTHVPALSMDVIQALLQAVKFYKLEMGGRERKGGREKEQALQ